MVLRWVMLCEIISIILTAFSPIHEELTLLDSVSDPVKAHVDGFGAALFYCVEGESYSHFVVCLDGGRRLGMSHFCEGGSDSACFSGVVVESCEFCFGG